MFGISFSELVLIGIVFLIVFGPEQLPEMARKFGKFSRELKRHTDSFRREFYNAVYTPTKDLRLDLKRELRTISSDIGDTLKETKPESKGPADIKSEKSDV